MKSNIENISDLKKKLNIEIPMKAVNAEFNNAFEYLRKKVKVKGFRKGKAPLVTIRNLYGEKIKGDVAQNLVQNSYGKVLEEHNLVPVGKPDIHFQSPEENKEFHFSVHVEVQPEIKLNPIESLKVEKEIVNVDDEMVEKTVEELLDSHSKMEDVVLIRELKIHDFAEIDFTGFIDGKPLEGGSAKGYILEIGSHSFIAGFEESLIGMKPGETKSIGLEFPEDYHVENLRKKPIRFEVKLNKIKKKQKPELNDEFVKNLNSNCKTVEEFKEQVKKNMKQGAEGVAERNLKNNLFDALVQANPFPVPETMLKEQESFLFEKFKKQMRQKLGDKKFSEEKWEYKGKMKEDISKEAEFIIRSILLIQKITKDNGWKVTEEELEAHLMKLSEQTGLDAQASKEELLTNREMWNQIEFQILEDKVFQLLLSKAQITPVNKAEEKGLKSES